MIHLWKNDAEGEAKINESLTLQQKDLIMVVEEFKDVMSNDPGRTDVVEHKIDTGTTRPFMLHLYRLPHAYREEVAGNRGVWYYRKILVTGHHNFCLLRKRMGCDVLHRLL